MNRKPSKPSPERLALYRLIQALERRAPIGLTESLAELTAAKVVLGSGEDIERIDAVDRFRADVLEVFERHGLALSVERRDEGERGELVVRGFSRARADELRQAPDVAEDWGELPDLGNGDD